MNKPLNPYEELGLTPDATPADIEQAYKRRAKETHPDKGGSIDAFDRTSRALAILEDPEKRKKFDAGEWTEEPNEKSAAYKATEIIAAHFDPLLAEFVKSGFAVHLEPKRRDVVALLMAGIRKDLSTLEKQLAIGNRVSQAMVDVRERLTGGPVDNPVGKILDGSRKSGSKAKIALEKQIETHELALAILRQYGFNAEKSGLIFPQ